MALARITARVSTAGGIAAGTVIAITAGGIGIAGKRSPMIYITNERAMALSSMRKHSPNKLSGRAA
jgi:hypothetical protein